MNTGNERLIEKYLDGTATPEEFAVLEKRLIEDPGARLALLQEAGFEDQLRLLLQSGGADAFVQSARARAETGDGTAASDGVGASARSRRLWFWASAAAAAGVAAALSIFGLWGESARNGPLTVAAGSPVVSSNEAAWAATLSGTNLTRQSALLAASATPEFPANLTTSGAVDRAVALSATKNGSERTDERPPLPLEGVERAPAPGVALANPLIKPDRVGKPAPAAVVRARTDGIGQVVAANGRVTITSGAGPTARTRQVWTGAVLLGGDIVSAESHSGGAFRYYDGTTVRIYDSTRIALVAGNDQTKTIRLAGGTVDVRISSQTGGITGVVVRTASIDVTASSGDFRVMADPNSNSSWVGTQTGSIGVSSAQTGQQTVLPQNACTVVAPNGPSFQVLSTANPLWQRQCSFMTGSASYP